MKKWVVLTIISTLASVCVAQTKPAKKYEKRTASDIIEKKPKLSPTVKFSMSMIENEYIDKEYVGIPAEEVIRSVKKMINIEKGEFESTSEFNSRKEAELAGKFLGNSTLQDIFAFVVPFNKTGETLRYKYNADTRDVSLYVLPEFISFDGIGSPDYISGQKSKDNLDNFFLSSSIVGKEDWLVNGIAANRIPFFSFKRKYESGGYEYYSNPVSVARFNMESSQAAKELPALKMLIVMKLASPYIWYNYEYIDLGIFSPTGIIKQYEYLAGDVLGVLLYSGLTGNIFVRMPENFGKLEPKTEISTEKK